MDVFGGLDTCVQFAKDVSLALEHFESVMQLVILAPQLRGLSFRVLAFPLCSLSDVLRLLVSKRKAFNMLGLLKRRNLLDVCAAHLAL